MEGGVREEESSYSQDRATLNGLQKNIDKLEVCHCDCVGVAVWVWLCHSDCVGVTVWVWLCHCDCVAVTVWVWLCHSDCVTVTVWVWLC